MERPLQTGGLKYFGWTVLFQAIQTIWSFSSKENVKGIIKNKQKPSPNIYNQNLINQILITALVWHIV